MIHKSKITGGLSYVRIITNILLFCQIDLCGESRFKMNAKKHEIIIGATNKNMGIFKDNDGIFKHREIASSISSYALMPEGGLTNQMLYDKFCQLKTLSLKNSMIFVLR